MKLYAKKKMFSWTQDFNIYNTYDEVVYTGKGQLDLFGRRKMNILNADGEVLAFLKEKGRAWSTTIEVFMNEQKVLNIRRKMWSFRPKYIIEGENWTVEGNFWGYDYTIYQDRHLVAVISKKYFSWTDTFEIDIQDESADIVNIISIVMAIHTDMEKQRTAAATSSS